MVWAAEAVCVGHMSDGDGIEAHTRGPEQLVDHHRQGKAHEIPADDLAGTKDQGGIQRQSLIPADVYGHGDDLHSAADERAQGRPGRHPTWVRPGCRK